MALSVEWDKTPLVESDDRERDLAMWQAVMGTEYGGTPGTAGADALEARIKAVRTYTAAWKTGGPGGAGEAPYLVRSWDRRGASTAPFLHGFDVTRMYATAAGTAEASPWALRRTGRIEFDKSLAGWWRVELCSWPHGKLLPDPAGYPARRSGALDTARWVTTPTLKLLDELTAEGVYGGFNVLDSWTGKGRRLFEAWNRAAEELHRTGSPALAATAKEASRQTIGLLNSSTYSTLRPDWHYAVIAQARCNLFRKMWRAWCTAAVGPLAVDTDCVWYAGITADPESARPDNFRLGNTPGCFKVKGTVAK